MTENHLIVKIITDIKYIRHFGPVVYKEYEEHIELLSFCCREILKIGTNSWVCFLTD